MDSEPSGTLPMGPTERDIMSSTNTGPTTADKVAIYNAAVYTASADPTEANMATVSVAYAALPAATRGGAMASALAGADPANLAALLAAHNDLPTASSRVEKRQVTDAEKDDIRNIVQDVLNGIENDIAAGAFDGDNGADEFLRDLTYNLVDQTRKFVANANIGSGKRTTHNVDPTDVIPAGSDIVCNYKGGNVVGRLNADNTVTVGDDTFPSLSKAAIAVTGQPTANGWVHWSYDGQKLATLRDAN